MSTATIAAVRPLKEIRADMAHEVAKRSQTVFADVKGVIGWLPKKAARALRRMAQFLHIPQMASFVRRNIMRVIRFVGVKAFLVELLTSHWGQSVVRGTIKTGAWAVRTSVKLAWRVVTLPIRLLGGRKTLENIETRVSTANARLTPNSGTTYSWLQSAHDMGANLLSADAMGIRLIRTGAGIAMGINVTRRIVPPGPFRWAAYAVDLGLLYFSLKSDLRDTQMGRAIWKKATEVEADLIVPTSGLIAEADGIVKDAASNDAAKLRKAAAQTKKDGEAKATEVLTNAVAEAERLETEAAQMERIAEQREAAAQAAAETAAAQTAVAVLDEPIEPAEVVPPVPPATPSGPAVPPAMGGRTPTPSGGKTTQPPKPGGGGRPHTSGSGDKGPNR